MEWLVLLRDGKSEVMTLRSSRSGSEPIRIALLTSGGDAPGMNACIRAVVKGSSIQQVVPNPVQVIGFKHGVRGLARHFDDDVKELRGADVSGIIGSGGTILGTSRADAIYEFLLQTKPELIADGYPIELLLEQEWVIDLLGSEALDIVRTLAIDGLVFIGGDQTCTAAFDLSEASAGEIPIIVIPASIDNDIEGIGESVGFDTAVQAAVSAVDAIRTTAASHSRIFIIESMGKDQGHIAVEVALACGAEEVLVPEENYSVEDIDSLIHRLVESRQTGRESALIIVAEGVKPGAWAQTTSID